MRNSVSALAGRRVYLDANVLIYVVEGTSAYTEQATLVLRGAAAGVFRAVTGDAAVAEVMVGPYRTGEENLVRSVRAFLSQRRLLEVVGHSAEAFDEAAVLRATLTMPFLDALHLATAKAAGCDALITNDRRMKPGLGVEVIALRSCVP